MLCAHGVVCVSLVIASTSFAGSLSIVATGDSITTGYAPIRLTLAMQAQGVAGNGYSIASGGATASLYVGDELDLNHKPEPAFHNQAEEAINGPVYDFGSPYGSVIEANPEPDAVIVMLGTNDAARAAAGNYLAWPTYQADMAGIYQYLATAVTPGGKRPDIFIATPLPMIAPQYAAANDLLDSTMIPWIENQVAGLQAQGLPVHLLDLNAAIRQQPDWQSWYSDGIHLYGANQAGYDWLASAILNGVLDTRLGDANLDGEVDGIDYTIWADHFNQSANWSQGDFNRDGQVTGADYTLWADKFGLGAAAYPNLALVPEPAGFGLLAVGLLLVAVGRGSILRRYLRCRLRQAR
ncbi:MAG: hypothetical protein K2Y37_23720 [Pirellulales bacterium]|nr:hypothetical protein [Pirellulales bacterium]